MRALQFGKAYPPIEGGIETAILNITEGLNARGVLCDALGANNENTYVGQCEGQYTIFRTKSYGKLLSSSLSPQLIKKYCQIKDNYDVIHIHFPDPLAMAAVFLDRPRGKLIVHWHSDIIRQRHLVKPFQPLIYWLLNRADAIIATSAAYAESSEYLRGFANKTAIIPFGINTTALKPNQEKVAEIRNRYRGKKIIYSLGRLVYYKGYDYLIEAAGRLSDDYVVIIGGDGPLSEKLKTTIAEKELSQKVVMPGSIRGADIGSYYEACDIFCLPSTERSEAFGIVLVEAMSFGKPLITTNIPTGVSWVNQHEQTGLLVKPKDAAALSQAIEKIAANQELYSLLSGNCRKRYSALFSQDKMIDAIIKLYTDLNRPK